ncbi:MAG: lipid-binding SYLF domain-containing protein [Elainellaceae cyanobacterium]
MGFRWAIASTAALTFILGASLPARADLAEEREEAVEELNRSREVFQTIATSPETQIPPSLLSSSQAIVIITNMGQGGFIFGGRGGDGLMMMRMTDGTWSNPIFVTLGGISFGLQVGRRSSDIVLLVRNSATIRDILTGDVELGDDVSSTTGPVGATVTDAAAASGDILIYSQSAGFFRGGTADGTRIELDGDRNDAFYGFNNITAYDIITNPRLQPIASPAALEQTLLSAEAQR